MLLFVSIIAFGRFLLTARVDPGVALVNASPPPTRVITLNSTGKALFQDNCSACHTLRVDGPASLFSIEQRIPDKRLLYDWIRNSSAVLKSGNKYFNGLVSKFGGARMIDLPHLTDNDITAVLEYIRQADTIRNNPTAIVVN